MSYTEHDETMDSRSLVSQLQALRNLHPWAFLRKRPVWRGQIPPETGQKA